ncbi:MAG: glycosyltransferase family 4 protein [Bacteroidales bacterium]|nr:glycosyltransferase family 4 protein [Bacteroidales bacterium]
MTAFVSKGHQVMVACSDHATVGARPSLNKEDGIQVLRIPSARIAKTTYLKKAVTLLSLGRKMLRSIREFYGEESFDLIIASTPPVTLSALFKKLKKNYKARFYLLVKDIWPQGSVDLGVFRKYSIIWQFLRYHEKATYRVADVLGTMSPMNRDYLLKHNNYLPAGKVQVCPNSIRPTDKPVTIDHTAIRHRYGIPDKACVFIFSGNLARGHGLPFLVEAMGKLADYPDAYFLIGGSGTHFSYLKKAIQQMNLQNVLLYKRLPAEDFKQLLGTSDVGLILLDKKYTIPQFPSRLLSYLDMQKPALCAVNSNTDIGTIVEEYACGKSIEHGDLDAFTEQLKYFSENTVERKSMGVNAGRLLEEKYTVQEAYGLIMEQLEHI